MNMYKNFQLSESPRDSVVLSVNNCPHVTYIYFFLFNSNNLSFETISNLTKLKADAGYVYYY